MMDNWTGRTPTHIAVMQWQEMQGAGKREIEMKSIQKRFRLAVRWMLYKLLHLAEMPLWVPLSTPSHVTYL